MTPSPPALTLAAVAGLALGSFAVTAGLRMARGETALNGRSRCDTCGRTLGFAQTIPLLAYARLGGACAGCGGRIDPIHAVGEVTGAAVLAASLFVGDPARSLLVAGLGLVLIAAATVDARTQRLPDALTIAAGLLALALAIMRSPAAIVEGLAAAAVVTGALLLLRWIAARSGRGDPGLGLGDVKLLAALALWLGVATPWAVAGAAIAGLLAMALVRPADGRLPFGPAIAAAGWTTGLILETGAWPTIP